MRHTGRPISMRDYLDADLLGIAVSDDQNLALRGAALSEIERRVGSMKRLATRSRSRPRWRPQRQPNSRHGRPDSPHSGQSFKQWSRLCNSLN